MNPLHLFFKPKWTQTIKSLRCNGIKRLRINGRTVTG